MVQLTRAQIRPNSPGYYIWLIIGGDTGDRAEACSKLGVGSDQLSALISNRNIKLLKELAPQLRAKFAEHYGVVWPCRREQFEEALSKSRTREDRPSREGGDTQKDVKQTWREQVGQMLQDIRLKEQEKGENVASLRPHIAHPGVRNNLENLENGTARSWTLYWAAANELVQVYGLSEDDGRIKAIRDKLDEVAEKMRFDPAKNKKQALALH